MDTENIPPSYKEIKKIEQKIIHKVKNFMVYQYNEKEDFKEGYWGEVEYEESKEIKSHILERILSELLSSSKIEDKEETISRIFDLIRDYLSATNFVREQKKNNIQIKDLEFFTRRSVTPFSQAYGMFYFVNFQEFCEEYLYSKIQSSSFEKIIIYDLICCEFSSFLDEKMIAFFLRVNLREKKYNPRLLQFNHFVLRSIKEVVGLIIYYHILTWFFFESKDLAMLLLFVASLLKNSFGEKKQLSLLIEKMTVVSVRLYQIEGAITASYVTKLINIAEKEGAFYPVVATKILDRAIEKKYW
jgi:hypothetical protein